MRPVDLNLLAVFEAVERERSVTRAALVLGLSQPAVSHALNRLRDQIKDQLFVRTPTGMDPTPRAVEMAGPVREAMAQLRATLGMERFDAASSRETFTIAVDNFAALVVVAPLAATVARLAPGMRLAARPSGTLDLDLLLGRGAVDLAIGEIADLSSKDRRHLVDDRYVAVMRRGHPYGSGPLTAQRIAAASHLKISSIHRDAGFMDVQLSRLGLSRTIALEAPYIAAGSVLAHSDMIGTVARRIADALCSSGDLISKELPFAGPPIAVGMTWPQIFQRRQSHIWLRSTVKDLFAGDAK